MLLKITIAKVQAIIKQVSLTRIQDYLILSFTTSCQKDLSLVNFNLFIYQQICHIESKPVISQSLPFLVFLFFIIRSFPICLLPLYFSSTYTSPICSISIYLFPIYIFSMWFFSHLSLSNLFLFNLVVSKLSQFNLFVVIHLFSMCLLSIYLLPVCLCLLSICLPPLSMLSTMSIANILFHVETYLGSFKSSFFLFYR